MALNYNLTNQEIKDTFQQLLQGSGSISSSAEMPLGSAILDGSGSRVNNLFVTSSNAVSSSHAIIADSTISAISADTASFFGEGLITASAVASTITFTKDNGSTFDVTVAQSGSIDSASYAAFASNAESASFSATAASASHAEFADTAQQAADLFITVKNTSGADIGKGLAVHATGVTGENVNIKLADSDISADMPAIGLTETAISNNGNGRVIINGRLKGVDTSTLVAGSPVYVNGSGSLTATKPTGSGLIQNIGTAAKINASDGEIILQGSGRSNDLPNITTDYVWKGDANGVPQAVAVSGLSVATASYVESAQTASYVNPLNQDVTVNGIISASGDISGSRISAANGFNTDQASALGFISTKAQSAFGNITVEQSTSPFVGVTIGSAAVPTRAPGFTMYTSHSFYPAGFNYAGITINDGDNGTTFYGNKVNAGGSGAVAPADKAAFVIQAGTTADSTTGDNTTFAINNDNGLPTFTKTLRTLKPISASAGIDAAGGFTGSLSGDVVSTGTSTFTNISVLGSGSFTGDQTFNNITVNGTGSFSYIESVTGSAKVIGDAFIILNNNTPAERYAGMIVQDSGSTLTTASFQWDGGNNEWFLEYSDDGGATAEHGIALFGPEYATKGSPTYLTNNTIPKSNGGHHLNDSNIIDNGTLVTVNSNISASGDISGSRFNATNGFQTDAASALGFISTKAQSAFGNITVDNSTSPFVGLTIGSAAAPTRAPGITMYTSHSKYPAGFNYAGVTINDGDNGVTFYGNKVNAGGTGAVAPSGQAAFAIQAGATADSTTGDNTSFAINNADGFPNFTKTTIFRRPVSASAGISASGDIDLQGNLLVYGTSNSIGGSTILTGSIVTTGSVATEVISGSHDGSNFSLDMAKGNMYTVSLVSGSNINIQPANIKKGGTVMLKTIQPSTSANSYGGLTYESSVKFSGGTALQPTQASGSVDVFTFVSFDGTTLDTTSVTDLK